MEITHETIVQIKLKPQEVRYLAVILQEATKTPIGENMVKFAHELKDELVQYSGKVS